MKHTDEERYQKFIQYCNARAFDPAKIKCSCGQPATCLKCQKPSCKRCSDGDGNNHKFVGNLLMQNPSRAKKQIKRRFRQHEIGPFDPDFYGHRVAL